LQPRKKSHNYKVAYVGQWLIGTSVKTGKGKIQLKDGSVYEGWWKEDKYHGRGRLIHPNGDCYEGMWQEGKAQG
jgi:hypothetical protein